MASQVDQQRELADRVGLTQERKNSQDRATGQRIISQLGQRQATACAKRAERLTKKQERARHHNTKVLLIRERRTSQEREEEERCQQELSQKLSEAELRQAAKLT